MKTQTQMKSISLNTSRMSKIKTFCKNVLPYSPNKKKILISQTTSFTASPSSLSKTLTSDEWGEIEKVFRFIDEDGDGKISPKELQRCVKAVGVQRLSVEEAEAVVECSDSDGDGLLSLKDFERLMEGVGLSEEEKKDELREAFVMYNDKKDESGVITPKSLKRMMSRLGESKTLQDCKGMIKVYDLNGDGVLCFDEFVTMMS